MAFYATEDWKKELCEIFFSRLKIIFGCTLAIFVGAVLVALFYPRTYQASASILMRSKGQPVRPVVMEKDPTQRDMPVSKEDMATELEVVTSSKLLDQTVRRLGLTPETAAQDDPYRHYGILNQPLAGEPRALLARCRLAILKYRRSLQMAVAPPPSPYAGAARDIRNALNAEVVPLSSVIKITLLGSNKGQIERVLNTMLDEYIVYRGEVYTPDTQESFFRERTAEYRKKVEEIESQLADGGTSASIALLEKEILSNVAVKEKLTEETALLRGELAEKEKGLQPLERALGSSDVQFFSFLENPVINYLGSKMADTIFEREKAAREFLPKSKKVTVIDEHVGAMSRRLKDEAARAMDRRVNDLDAAKSRIETLEKAIESIDLKNEELQRQLILARHLDREMDFWLDSYKTFSKRREEVEIDLAIRRKNFSPDVSILSDAAYSSELLHPRKLATLILGLIVGFVTGCSLGFLVEYLDHSLKRPYEVERYAELPVIGSIRTIVPASERPVN